jgi:mannitol/fructose-specific phosphotransferase system IIA component (Ntr-type)
MSTIAMTDLLTPERVLPPLRARGKAAAVRALAAAIARDAGVSADVLLERLLPSPDLPPLMPRGGVSLLHTVVAGLQRPMAAFARLDPPLHLGAADGCPTDLAVMLASPQQRPQDHLRALAAVARRLRRRDVLERLRSSPSRDVSFVVLTQDDWAGGRTSAAG